MRSQRSKMLWHASDVELRMRSNQLLSRSALLRVAAVSAFPASLSLDTADAAEARDVIVIIRHAEKPDGTEAPYGITEEGEQSAGSLTVRGWTRAGALAEAFLCPGKWDVPVPTAIYASKPGEEFGLRALQTVTPLAERLGLEADRSFRRGEEAGLAAALLAGRGCRLVAWEHHSIPDIVAHLGTVTPSTIGKWRSDRYDVIWRFERDSKGWEFRAIPQDLLAGDKPAP